MKTILAAAFLVPLLALACNSGQRRADEPVRFNVRVVQWPAASLLAAQSIIERYGQPEEVHADRMVWLAHWPWKRIVVSAGSPQAPLEQIVAYSVPKDKLQDLERFSRNLLVDKTRGELSFLSDREDYNRLALNLADDVVRGRRTSEQARRFFEEAIRLSLAGKSSPYMKTLLFEPLPVEPRPSRLERF
jgi:hypothetical protein